MSDKQIDLILQIVLAQLDAYLAPELAEDICDGIQEGIFINLEVLGKLAEG